MATGMARGAKARGKRIAFGDKRKIIWDHNSETIFRGNPNVAPPGSEGAKDIEWRVFHRGNRIYNHHDVHGNRWVWNHTFRPTPGEIFFTDDELRFAENVGSDFVVIEPNVPTWKNCAANKQWPVDRYEDVARELTAWGHECIQLEYGERNRIPSAASLKTPTFRHALAVLTRSEMYIGPEGGLHHGAAAVEIPAVVIFGGFIPPQVTGYATHTNLAAGGEACGSLRSCDHCLAAMRAIAAETVYDAAVRRLARVAV